MTPDQQPVTKAELKAELKAALEGFAAALIGNLSDLREEMQRQRAPGQREADGIHKERHVVVHDIDNGVRRNETMLAQCGVEHPHQRGPAPLLREHEVRQRSAGKILRLVIGEILGVHIGKVSL